MEKKWSLDEKAQAQWPGRWSYGGGFWSEDDPRDSPRMIVDPTGMDYLLKQIPENKKKEPKEKDARVAKR